MEIKKVFVKLLERAEEVVEMLEHEALELVGADKAKIVAETAAVPQAVAPVAVAPAADAGEQAEPVEAAADAEKTA
jgi:hypothetical protein